MINLEFEIDEERSISKNASIEQLITATTMTRT